MNLSRMVAMSDVIMNGHVLNWFWRDREHRRAVRSDVIARVIPRYFKRYLPAAAAVKEFAPIRDDKGEKIFSIWLQGEENAPALVKACFRSIRAHCTQELVVLDEKTLFEYIKLPDIIMEKRKKGMIKNAHFADICRVELLYQYGGFWLDSTGFVTSPIPQWIVDQDFFVYLTGQRVGSPYSFMQNCFIRARKGAYLLAAWRAMILDYWSHENSSFDYFMHQLLFKALVTGDARAKKYFNAMPHVDQDPTHAVWWDIADKPFNKKDFDKHTAGAFFQKTAYKSPYAEISVAGTTADVMINKMNKD